MKLINIAQIYNGLTCGREYCSTFEFMKDGKKIQVINKSDIDNGKLINSNIGEYYLRNRYINEIGTKRIVRTIEGDILFKRVSPYNCIIIDKDSKGLFISNCYSLIRCAEKGDIETIKTILTNKYVIRYLKNISKTEQDTISINALENMPIGKDVIKLTKLLKEQEELIEKQYNQIFQMISERTE